MKTSTVFGGSSDESQTVISRNLALLDREIVSAAERRLLQLSDRAALILSEDNLLTSEERVAEFCALFETSPIDETLPGDTRVYLKNLSDAALLADKLAVCRFLADRLATDRSFVLPRILASYRYDQPPAEELHLSQTPRIAYFKNAYADAAFRVFSSVLSEPTVSYAGDFSAACEEVYYGRADMCILPVDSSRDAKLVGFYRLIDKYELHIVLACDIPSADGSVTTRFALLQKALELPSQKRLEKADGCYFEFTLIPGPLAALADVLCAAERCGLGFFKIDALPLSYSDSEFSYDVILKTGGELEAFALYLSLAVPQCEPLGIYPKLRS